MSRPSSDSYGDLSFPEIPSELWSQLCQNEPEGPVPKINRGESPDQIDIDVLEEDVVRPETRKEESDSGLWEEFADIQTEDLLEVEPEISTPTPASAERVASSPPLYLILDQLFDDAASGDIEEGGMSVWSAGNLIRKYKSNGSLSVTNLLQPLWCEYKTYYGLVGLERRGVEGRLKEFEVSRKVLVDNKIVEKTVTIKPDQAAVHKGEQHKVRGQKIHEKLEREVVPLRIRIRTKTREEVWGLKLLNMIAGLVELKKNGRWRELPVFGFIHNISVNGIIDELVLEPCASPDIGNILRITDIKTKLARSRLDRDPPKEHKVQLMVYKQLLDGLLVPNFNWTNLFETYQLEYLETFSDAFIAKSIVLAESNELGKEAEDARNLEDLTKLWDSSVQDLNLLRREVAPELSVQYRQAMPSILGPLNIISDTTPSPDLGDSTLIARQTFEYDEDFVQQAISQALEFWLGTRQQVGVDIDETWKCDRTSEAKKEIVVASADAPDNHARDAKTNRRHALRHLDPPMVNFQDQQNNEKLTVNQNHDNSTSPGFLKSGSAGDLEAATSPSRTLSPPNIIAHHRAESIPGSVTSLPVQGIDSAPTHRRRRNRRRRNQQHIDQNGGPVTLNGNTAVPQPRRANSLPANPAARNADGVPPGQPFDWLKNLDTLLVPKKKIVQRPNITQCFVNTVKYSWINVMLLIIPVAWAVHFSHQSDTLVFVFSFLSIIPLAALLGFATEELANYTGPTIGGLFNATFGNAVELIISILALVKGQLRIVQAAMLGSILSNCLLVLGMCFLAGGFRFHEQGYGVRIAQQHISLLSLCVFSISIPAAFSSSVKVLEQSAILSISRATAVILLVCYIAFLVFQLWTHSYLYTLESSKRHAAVTFVPADDGTNPPIGQSVFRVSSIFSHSSSSSSSSDNVNSPTTATVTVHVPASEEEEEEIPKLTVKFAFALLLGVTVLTGLTAEFLVDSINGLIETTQVTEEFVALILLPLVGNAAEHVTAVTVSVRNKLDLALAVAVGSSIQIALFVLPFLVILGWIIGQPLSLNFDTFEVIMVVISVIVVNFAISDGRTNWLEGFILMVTYLLIGVAVFYYN